MNFTTLIHLGIISSALLIGSLLRSRIRLFQRFLLPASIIGGGLLMLFYNYVSPVFGLTADFLGNMVYHLLNLSFIAMMLRTEDRKENRITGRRLGQSIVANIFQYGFQATFGLLATVLMINTFFPDLFPAFGLCLPLGFELGPGQAYSMTLPWEAMGFRGATSVGLSMAAIGFLVGSVGGVILINIGIHRGWVSEEAAEKMRSKGVQTGFLSRDNRKVGSYNVTDGESIDSLSYHAALIIFTYLLSYLFMKGLEFILHGIGPLGVMLMDAFWGINFVFSVFMANFVKFIMKKCRLDHTVDNGTMNRINGLSVDLTVVSSLGAISIAAITSYLVPIMFLTLVGILIVGFAIPYYTSRIYEDNQFKRMLLLYGAATGTLPTGLSLLRVVDPDFETPVASDFVYASSIMFFLEIPLILCINFPAVGYVNGNPMLFWLLTAFAAFYLIASIIAYRIIAGKRAFAQKHLFYRTEA